MSIKRVREIQEDDLQDGCVFRAQQAFTWAFVFKMKEQKRTKQYYKKKENNHTVEELRSFSSG